MSDYIDNGEGQVDSGATQQTTQGQQNDQQAVNPAAIRKSTQQSMLKAASNAAGMEFQSMEDLISTVARLSQAQSAQPAQQAQPQGETAAEKQKRITATDLQDQLQAMQAKFEQTQQLARERELDISIRNAMGDKFDAAFSDYTMNEIKKSLKEQDGEWLVVNNKNQQRYTESGTPMTVQNLIDELGRANPKLLRAAPQPQGGSGLRPQGNMFDGVPGDGEFVPDYTRDPAAFEQWASRKGLSKNNGLKGVGVAVQNSSPGRLFGTN
jgi:hypothetical protein